MCVKMFHMKFSYDCRFLCKQSTSHMTRTGRLFHYGKFVALGFIYGHLDFRACTAEKKATKELSANRKRKMK